VDHELTPASRALLEHLRGLFAGRDVAVIAPAAGPIRELVPAMHVLTVDPAPGGRLYATAGVWDATSTTVTVWNSCSTRPARTTGTLKLSPWWPTTTPPAAKIPAGIVQVTHPGRYRRSDVGLGQRIGQQGLSEVCADQGPAPVEPGPHQLPGPPVALPAVDGQLRRRQPRQHTASTPRRANLAIVAHTASMRDRAPATNAYSTCFLVG
jgi:hypothetical protein